MIWQEAEQEGRRHHGDQVHGALFVATTMASGQTAAVEVGAGSQAFDEFAVANDDR